MRKDFEKYFVKLQLDYNKLQKDLEKVNKEAEEGLLTDEQRASFENYFNRVKTNYDRMAYARYLLRLPPKWIQNIESKIATNKIKKELEKFKEAKADEESVLQENKEALEKIEGDN